MTVVEMKFNRIPLQYIAALGDADATSGNNAQAWGLWPVDPGPRGVRLNNYDRLQKAGGVAPQDEHNGVRLGADDLDHFVGERLPTMLLM